jgi:hypothetical protein
MGVGAFMRRLIAIVTLAGCLPAAHAQVADENAVKAVFLVRFGAFVEWPREAFAAPTSPISICMTGPSAVADKVREAARGELIAGRTIQVQALQSELPEGGCHIVYVGDGGDRRTTRILAEVRRAPALVVTDETNSDHRGMIHFVVINSRVRFHIDRGRAEQAGLRLGARLLNIALTVQDASGLGGTP